MIEVHRPPFAGFGPNAVRWFEGLAADNSRDYFIANRAVWDAEVQDPLADLLHEIAEEVGGTVRRFRPWRDVRFSKDKRPIKEQTGGYAHRPGTHGVHYAALSRDGLYCGTGFYAPARDQLARFRSAIASDHTGPALEEAVASARAAGLAVDGDALATAPRGFAADHSRIALLRLKQLVAGRTLAPGPELESRAALDFARATWAAAEPIILWLDAHVGESEIPPEERWGRG